MFDGELPVAECELLSRRIDRDDRLRARWSRYALIGAAMRCEPVATARGDFAARVSRAVDGAVVQQGREARRSRRHRYVWQGALAASLVATVAGLSLLMLRQVAFQSAAPAVAVLALPATPHPAAAATVKVAARIVPKAASGALREPFSYVTPASGAPDTASLRTEM